MARSRKRLVVIIVAIVVVAVLAIPGFVFVRDRFIEWRANRAASEMTVLITSVGVDTRKELKPFEEIFNEKASLDFLYFRELENIEEILVGVGVAESEVQKIVENGYAALEDFVQTRRGDYAGVARKFWGGLDEFAVESVEEAEDGEIHASKVSVRILSGRRYDVELYFAPDGRPMYPYPASAPYYAIGEAATRLGSSLAGVVLISEGLLEDCVFGFPEAVWMEKLASLASAAPDGWKGFDLMAGLLDTSHDEETLKALSALIPRLAECGRLSMTERDTCEREAAAIGMYLAGDYRKAMDGFLGNLGSGLPGTCYYISLCAEKLGRELFPGASMRDIAENLR